MDLSSVITELEEQADTGDEWKSAVETKAEKLTSIQGELESSVYDLRQIISKLNDFSETMEDLTKNISEAEAEDISL